jgi:hypothetical protein
MHSCDDLDISAMETSRGEANPAPKTLAIAPIRSNRCLQYRAVEKVALVGAPVRQDQGAEEFGSSHVPVREAFRLLEAEGLLVALPRKGVRVAPLEPESVFEISLMRSAFEGLALHLQQAMS